MSRAYVTMFALFMLSSAGCGTFSDAMCGPISDHVYYRGVRFDALAVSEGGPMVLMAADMPFSAVADTLLVPYLAYHQLKTPAPERASSKGNADETRLQKNP